MNDSYAEFSLEDLPDRWWGKLGGSAKKEPWGTWDPSSLLYSCQVHIDQVHMGG